MAGTVEGGKLAAKTNKKLYGDDFYNKIGAAGGHKSVGGGFSKNPELARRAGAIGGQNGKRNRDKERLAREMANDSPTN